MGSAFSASVTWQKEMVTTEIKPEAGDLADGLSSMIGGGHIRGVEGVVE